MTKKYFQNSILPNLNTINICNKINILFLLLLCIASKTLAQASLDTDNDGIVDTIDLDDDNDGILDLMECGCISLNTFGNGSFETPIIPYNNGWNTNIAQTNVPNWQTTASDGMIEIWPTNGNGGNAAQGNQFVELNATQASTLYQIFCIRSGGGTISWSVKHRGRNGVDVAEVRIGTSLTNYTTVRSMSDGNSAWGSYSGVYNVASGTAQLYVMFAAVSSAGGNPTVGNFLDDVQITINTSCADTDGDGITNDKDIDSDNDGCSDAFEAGATTNMTPNFQFAASTVGTNGLSSLVENNDTQNATTTYTSTYNNAINAVIKSCCPSIAPTLSGVTLVNTCPITTVNLNNLVTSPPPNGSTLRWFNNATAFGAPLSTPTAVSTSGLYYAFYYNSTNNCYTPASPVVTVTVNACCNASNTAPRLR